MVMSVARSRTDASDGERVQRPGPGNDADDHCSSVASDISFSFRSISGLQDEDFQKAAAQVLRKFEELYVMLAVLKPPVVTVFAL